MIQGLLESLTSRGKIGEWPPSKSDSGGFRHRSSRLPSGPSELDTLNRALVTGLVLEAVLENPSRLAHSADEEWFAVTPVDEGSSWPIWQTWLAERSGDQAKPLPVGKGDTSWLSGGKGLPDCGWPWVW